MPGFLTVENHGNPLPGRDVRWLSAKNHPLNSAKSQI
jgi:hypothetical protein